MKLMVVIMLAIPVAAQAGIYKCKVDGATVYQSNPCENGKEIIVRDSSSGIGRTSASSVRPGEAEMIRNLDLRNAAKAHKIMRGMTERRVIYAWGKPDKINRGGLHSPDQWVYRRNRSTTQYVYFKNGKVVSWN